MSASDVQYRVNNLLIRPGRSEIDIDAVAVHVEPIVMKILVYLVENAPRTISQDELLTEIWPGVVVEESTVHRRISQLRTLLGDNARHPEYIQTVPKQGYRILPNVEKIGVELEEQGSAGNWNNKVGTPILIILIAMFSIWLVFVKNSSSRTDTKLLALAAHSIAVLPFQDLNGHQANQQVAQSLKDGIVDRFVQQHSLRVAALTSTEIANAEDTALPDLGEQLGAGYIMEGSLQKMDDHFRVTARVSRTSDNTHVWSKVIEANAEDILNTHSNVVQKIVRSSFSALDFDIHRRYGWGSYGSIDGRDPRALDLFFKGEDEFRRLHLGEGGNVDIGERLIRQAVEIDTAIYAAHLSLANIHISRKMGTQPFLESKAQARISLDAAKASEPEGRDEITFQEAQYLLYLEWDYNAAEVLLEKMLAKEAKCAWCYAFLADIDIRRGNLNQARSHLASAISISNSVDSEESQLWIIYGELLASVGDTERAIQSIETATQFTSSSRSKTRMLLSLANQYSVQNRRGKVQQIIDEIQLLDPQIATENYIFLLAYLGKTNAARDLIAAPPQPLHHYGYLALAYQQLGEAKAAKAMIESGIANRDNLISTHLRTSPLFEPFRTSSAYPQLLARLRAEEFR